LDKSAKITRAYIDGMLGRDCQDPADKEIYSAWFRGVKDKQFADKANTREGK